MEAGVSGPCHRPTVTILYGDLQICVSCIAPGYIVSFFRMDASSLYCMYSPVKSHVISALIDY
jgi:hypothetical protein